MDRAVKEKIEREQHPIERDKENKSASGTDRARKTKKIANGRQ